MVISLQPSRCHPPPFSFCYRSWVYAASGLVVTGTWLMAFAQSVFMLYIVLWFKARNASAVHVCVASAGRGA